MLKNKLFLFSPIIALAVIFIFSLTLFPTVQPQPKNLPIAVVNEDVGMEIPSQPKMNMGQTIVDMIQKNTPSTKNEEPAVKWVEVESVKAVKEGLDEQKYYAALIIPSDFSVKQASFQTPAPTSSEVQIWINQGMNTAASTMAGQMLNGVVDNMNSMVREQQLAGFTKKGALLTVEQATTIATPIEKKVTNVHEIGSNSANGNSPMSLFQPLWIASLASAAILFLSMNKRPLSSRKESLIIKGYQLLMGAVVAFFIGFGLSWIVEGMVGLNIPDYLDTALFLTITSFSFIVMILAVLSLVGMKGLPIFALLLFFGAPLLAMAPEMMSPFYRDWIHAWLPMRFMVEGLRNMFFFGEGLSWNSSVVVLVWIGLVSVVVILASAFLRRKEKIDVTAPEIVE